MHVHKTKQPLTRPLRVIVTGVAFGGALTASSALADPGHGKSPQNHVTANAPGSGNSGSSGAPGSGSSGPSKNKDFVKRVGPRLKLKGNDFRFAGSNNYYLPYKSQTMVDDVLTDASNAGFRAMRTWAGFDIGNQDGSNSTFGKADGVVYFQYYTGSEPAYNDGADGLQRLDYVISKAGQLGIRLVVPLVNNWSAFGGMDQYVAWAGGSYHDEFYTNAQIKGWFKAWASHLLNRTNSITGVKYKDDPTIMTWELANEPRCGGDLYPTSGACSTTTLTAWADEMSRYIASIDKNHLISVGDEGFTCTPGASDWTQDCSQGVDTVALASLPKVDVMSFHLYPDSWGKSASWGTTWIEDHFASALSIDKPAMLGEFGISDPATRNAVYKEWTDAVFAVGGAGALYWILSGVQDDGSLYPDYDGYTVYCPSSVCTAVGYFAADMSANAELNFAPVADDDDVTVDFEQVAMLMPLSNDVAYNGASLVPGSLDLDPTIGGQQSSVSVPGGSFVAAADGKVEFTPEPGFSGTAVATYSVADSLARVSTLAQLRIEVREADGAELVLFDFETGTEGWTGAGSVEQSPEHATRGIYSLKVSGTSGDWFGTNFAQPLNLVSLPLIEWDVYSTLGTSQQLAVQMGTAWDWCEGGGWAWVNGGTATTMQLDLSQLSCTSGNAPDLTQVNSLRVYLGNGGGDVFVDNVRVKPDPNAMPSQLLHSFEADTEGWSGPGTLTQSTEFATDGATSLKIDGSSGGWFGTVYASALDFTGKTALTWDVYTPTGTSQQLSIQLGAGWDWCEGGGYVWVNGGQTTAMTIDLASLACSSSNPPDLTQVNALNIYMANGGGPVFVDNVRVH